MSKYLPKLLTLIVIVFTYACGGGGGGDSSNADNYKLEVVAENLAFPIRIAELDSKQLVVAELNSGNLNLFNLENQTKNLIANFSPADANAIGLAGLLVDRDYNSNKYIFVYHFDRKTNRNLVTRLTFENAKVTDRKQILFLTPPTGHNGGGMAQKEDGTILLGIGDGGQAALAQNPKEKFGKVLAFARDGSLLNNSEVSQGIYATGLRNPFGIDGNGNNFFVADNGPTCEDEVDVLKPSANYGWKENYSCNITDPGTVKPIYSWSPSTGLTDILFYTKSKLKSLNNKILVSRFLTNSISSLGVDDSKENIVSESELFKESGEGPFIDLLQTEDGDVYLTTPSKILKVIE